MQISLISRAGAGGNLFLYYNFARFCEKLNENEVFKAKLREYFAFIDDIAFSLIFEEKKYLKQAEDCFFSLQELIDEENSQKIKAKPRISFYFGNVGVYTLGALLFARLKDKKNFNFCVERVLETKKIIMKSSISSHYDELLYGLAGYLYCLLQLQREFQAKPADFQVNLENYVMDLVEELLDRGIRNFDKELSLEKLISSKKFPENFHLVYTFHEKAYLGAAHGFFGVLNTLYSAYILNQSYFESFNKDFTAVFLDSLAISLSFYLGLQLDSGNFPTSFARLKKDELVQFCHGSPGAVSPLILARKIHGNNAKLAENIGLALEKACENIWKYGILKKGYGLCHGISGNAYAFLNVFNETKHEKWLYRALKFAILRNDLDLMKIIEEFEFADRYVAGKSDNPYSLMLGLSGDLVFMLHCFMPEEARFFIDFL